MIPSSPLTNKGQQGVYFRTYCYCSTCRHKQSRHADKIFFVRHIRSLIYFRPFALSFNNQSKPPLERIFRESLVSSSHPCAVRNEDSRYEIDRDSCCELSELSYEVVFALLSQSGVTFSTLFQDSFKALETAESIYRVRMDEERSLVQLIT